MPTPRIDTFTLAYVEAMLWSSTDESDDQGGEPLDANYSISDLSSDALARIITDCAEFQRMCDEYIDGSTSDAGHDFWLTRNGHGAGFWDGHWPEPQATLLTLASQAFGEIYPYVSDDGEVCL